MEPIRSKPEEPPRHEKVVLTPLAVLTYAVPIPDIAPRADRFPAPQRSFHFLAHRPQDDVFGSISGTQSPQIRHLFSNRDDSCENVERRSDLARKLL